MLELGRSLIPTHIRIFVFAKFDGTERGKVLRIVRSLDELFRRHALGNGDLALLPRFGNVVLPCLAHALNETVGAAEQQDVRTKGVPARED